MRGHMRILNHFTFQHKGKDLDLIGLYNQQIVEAGRKKFSLKM